MAFRSEHYFMHTPAGTWGLGVSKGSIPMSHRDPLLKQQDYWIRNLGFAFPHGCNVNINNTRNFIAKQANNVNVMKIFSDG
jgi:hypothetical protein